VIEALKPWFEASLAKVPKGGKLADALGYRLNHWGGLCLLLEDGRLEIDSNMVERSIRGLALTRKNALFAGHDRGAAGWAMIASLLETCKLNRVDPLAWTTDVLTKLVNRWPASRIDELMPWAHREGRVSHSQRGVAGPLTFRLNPHWLIAVKLQDDAPAARVKTPYPIGSASVRGLGIDGHEAD
jgi:hypothetical protein